jgi:putative CocE/NonD family hydrolase
VRSPTITTIVREAEGARTVRSPCDSVARMRRTKYALLAAPIVLSCGGRAPEVHAPPPAKAPAKAADKPADCPAAAASAAPPQREFTWTKVMIPMRDGVHLETVISAPADAQAPLPILFLRSPYGVPTEKGQKAALNSPSAKELNADGYIWARQNLRGRFGSEGTFVMSRPPRDRANPKAIDEATDAYDTIEWLVANVPKNNGRVGMMGTSYDAWTATMAELDPHPALRAIVEEASPADQFLGDDFHHNGAFRLAYGFQYVALLETGKTNTVFAFERGDMFDFYLALGPLSNADKRYFHGKMPTWNDFVAHPSYDDYWKRQSFDTHLVQAKVPIMNVAGWWDQEDFYGPLRIHALLEKEDVEKKNYLVAGPWNHGGWYGPGRALGAIDFGSDTGVYYRAELKAPFLARFLHDKGKGDWPEATVFETGTNRWRTFERWPPEAGVTRKKLYLRAGRSLSFEAPAEAGASDTYVSDPQRPVPYQPRPIASLFTADQWPVWQVQDQRFADGRPDVLTYSTPVLEEDVAIAGDVAVELHAATSGTDSDWIVKLIDVFPEGPPPPRPAGQELGPPPKGTPPDLRGYQLMIAGDVLRGRFRGSFEKPAPIKANTLALYTVDLRSRSHVFQKGHRIMLQVQSTWFPVIDRNPQRYVKNIFEATEADFIVATQRISRAKEAPSAIVLPVVGK